jgi:hypothetical protein
MIGHRVLRRRKCQACKKSFVTEELGYFPDMKKGSDLAHDMQVAEYEIMKKKMLGIPTRTQVTTSKPVKKRKVAPPPKMVNPENGPYLTYGDLFKKFESMTNWTDINDFRPYPLLDYSIIVWTNDGTERAYQYDPENFRFVLIEDAKTYEEILENAWRKKP